MQYFAKLFQRALLIVLATGLFFGGLSVGASAVDAATRQSYVEGEVLVLLKNPAGQESLSAKSLAVGAAYSSASSVAASVSASVEKTYNSLSIQSGNIFTLMKSGTKTTEQLTAELKTNPNVLAVSPNYIDYASYTPPNDPRYSQLWGLTKIRVDQVWPDITGSSQVYVAVGDTGVDYIHEDLQANVDTNLCRDYTSSPNGYKDVHSHGTHVSGTIAAEGNNGKGVVGVNWTAKVIALKVLSDSGSGSTSLQVAAVDYLVSLLNQGYKIPAFNLSLGGWGSSVDPVTSANGSDVRWNAFKALSDMNKTLIVIAAGNESREVGKPNVHYQLPGELDSIALGRYVYPASYTGIPNMIVVSAIDSANKAASFTNWSATAVDLAAPGVSILSTITNNLYGSKSGTSMATPHVTGAIALLAAANPAWTASQLKAALLDNANAAINPILTMPTVTGFNPANQTVSSKGLMDVKAAYDTIGAVPVANVDITPATTSTLYTNEASQKTVQLTATVTPANATNQAIQWSSSSPTVATVSSNGLVTAVGNGTATITAKAQGGSNVSKSVSVTVNTYATGLTINPSTIDVAPGGSASLVATVSPSSSSNASVIWDSSNPGSVSVSGSGVVSVSPGATVGDTATITAAAGGSRMPGAVAATATVTVKNSIVYVSSINITPSPLSLAKGATEQLSATVLPANATTPTVSWTSSSDDIATVSASGTVTGVSAGTATITATAQDGSNVSQGATVTVTDPGGGVPPSGNVTVGYMEGVQPWAEAGLPVTCTIGTSALVSNASLAIVYPDGSTHPVTLQVTGTTLVFTFTPPVEGTYVLTFTLTEPDGTVSAATLDLNVESGGETGGPSVIIDFSDLGVVNGVLKLSPGETVKQWIRTVPPSGATFSASGLPAGLSLTPEGRLYGSVAEIGTYPVTVTATLDGYVATGMFTVEVAGYQGTVSSGKGSGGCDAGVLGGCMAGLVAMAAFALHKKDGKK